MILSPLNVVILLLSVGCRSVTPTANGPIKRDFNPHSPGKRGLSMLRRRNIPSMGGMDKIKSGLSSDGKLGSSGSDLGGSSRAKGTEKSKKAGSSQVSASKPTSDKGAVQEGSNGCNSYFLVGSRGTGEGQKGSIAYSNLQQKIMSAIPGGGRIELISTASAEYLVSVEKDSKSGTGVVNEKMSKCPKALFFFFGYSKGAIVITKMINSKKIPADKIAGVVFFGSPCFRPGLKQNRCGGKSGHGMASGLNPPIPDAVASKTFDCCLPHDPVCLGGTNMQAHLSYGTKQDEALRFAIDQLQATLSGKKKGAKRI